MIIKYHRKTIERKANVKRWLLMATDYVSGMSAVAVANKYINPKTDKPYTRGAVYGILKKVQKLKIK